MKWKRAAQRGRGNVNGLANQGAESAASAIAGGCGVVTKLADSVTRWMASAPDGVPSVVVRLQAAMARRAWNLTVKRCRSLLGRLRTTGPSSEPTKRPAGPPAPSGARQAKRSIAAKGAKSTHATEGLSRAAKSAEVAMARQDWPKAIGDWERLLERFGDEAPASAYVGLSQSYRALPRLTQARAVAARGLAEYPESLPCMIESAEVAVAEGNWAEAVSLWQSVLDRCPLGGPLEAPLNPDRTATPWKQLLRRLGGSTPDSAYARLASRCRSASRLEEAEAIITRGMERYTDSVVCTIECAEVAMRRKDWSEAAKRWENVLERAGVKARESAYRRLAVSYRELSRFADAEAVLGRGLQHHPGSTACMVEHAEIAMTRRDWPEAVKRWKHVLEHAGSAAPASAYAKLAASHRALSELSEAEAVVARGLARYPANVRCLLQHAEIATERKAMEEALVRWKRVLDRQLGDSPEPARSILGQNALRLKRDRPDQFIDFARNLPANLEPPMLALCAKLHQSYSALKARDATGALRGFEAALRTVDGPFPRETWLSSFEKLAHFYCDEPSVDAMSGRARTHRERQAAESPVCAPVKLCVAGTGWSGSGAIYDYFKEFREVAPTDRLGELQYVEGTFGFGSMSRHEDFKDYLVSLYSTTLLGLPNLDDLQGTGHVKAAKRARVLTFGPNARAVARAVETLTDGLIAAHAGGAERRQERYARATSEFIDRVLLLETLASTRYILVDNFVHCQNVRMIDSLSGVQYFASFRDPRTQYVAIVYERARAPITLSQFIKRYRASTESFNRDKLLLRGTSNAVHVVQFERFVLDEAYRDELATSVGLDLERRDKYCYFRPWQSKKNAFIHETYAKQDEIRAIEAQLPEYCIDLHKLKEAAGELP